MTSKDTTFERYTHIIKIYRENPSATVEDVAQIVYGTTKYARFVVKHKNKAIQDEQLPADDDFFHVLYQVLVAHLTQRFPQLQIHSKYIGPDKLHHYKHAREIIVAIGCLTSVKIAICEGVLCITRNTLQRNIPKFCELDMTDPNSISQLEKIIYKLVYPSSTSKNTNRFQNHD